MKRGTQVALALIWTGAYVVIAIWGHIQQAWAALYAGDWSASWVSPK